jgi:hypothetical protein
MLGQEGVSLQVGEGEANQGPVLAWQDSPFLPEGWELHGFVKSLREHVTPVTLEAGASLSRFGRPRDSECASKRNTNRIDFAQKSLAVSA